MAKKGGGINKPVTVSEELFKITKKAKLSRGQITKAIWDHIKKYGLQDCDNRRIINCDECLYAVFRKKKVNMLEMPGLLKNHIFTE